MEATKLCLESQPWGQDQEVLHIMDPKQQQDHETDVTELGFFNNEGEEIIEKTVMRSRNDSRKDDQLQKLLSCKDTMRQSQACLRKCQAA